MKLSFQVLSTPLSLLLHRISSSRKLLLWMVQSACIFQLLGNES